MENCGNVIDIYLNAAINIHNRGLEYIVWGTYEFTPVKSAKTAELKIGPRVATL